MLCVGWVGGVLVRVDAFFVGLVATAFVAIGFHKLQTQIPDVFGATSF